MERRVNQRHHRHAVKANWVWMTRINWRSGYQGGTSHRVLIHMPEKKMLSLASSWFTKEIWKDLDILRNTQSSMLKSTARQTHIKIINAEDSWRMKELLEDDETQQRSHNHQLREDMWIAKQNEENDKVKDDGAKAEGEKTLQTMRIWSTGFWYRFYDDVIALIENMIKLLLEIHYALSPTKRAWKSSEMPMRRVTQMRQKYTLLPESQVSQRSPASLEFALVMTLADPNTGLQWNFDKLDKHKKTFQLM